MTQDNANNKLTLSGKSTLTLKNIGDASRSHSHDGKKFVQVEVRKKRIINPAAVAESKVEIDEVTAQKLKLIAEAKEHEARRRRAAEQQADGTVAHAHPGKIALCIGNQNAMDAPQGDLHQGIEPGRSFHCVASCEKYQAVSRSTTSP